MMSQTALHCTALYLKYMIQITSKSVFFSNETVTKIIFGI